ncbi:hypothetical protein HYT58_03180, partial [Candidatus Woesearchaeota archaeon]|nr:hypothetical protein [Candidatus Woesearchaeota archaeon]
IAGQQGFIHQWFYESYGFTNPNAKPQEIKKGIRIVNELKPLRSYYLLNENPELVTKVYVDALDIDTKAYFYFRINDTETYGGKYRYSKILVNGQEISKPTSIEQATNLVGLPYNIQKLENKTLFLTAQFNPVSLSENSNSKKFDVEFGSVYEMISKSRLRAYTLTNELLGNIKDPFKDISYAYLNKKERTTQTECISGCGLATLSMTVNAEQPLTTPGEYQFGIRLLGASGWMGRIINVKSLKILVPNSLVVVTNNCAFSGSGGNYELKPAYIDDLNSRLNQTLPDITYWCAFTVQTPKQELGMYENLVAEVSYDYAFEKLATAELEIRKIPGAS